jgi:hypothetical protein
VTELPAWMADLDDEDGEFVRRFVLASGSLKDLAAQYGVSYPTLRARLDRLIAKVKASSEAATADPMERTIRVLVADGSIAAATGKQLLAAYRASKPKGGKS